MASEDLLVGGFGVVSEVFWGVWGCPGCFGGGNLPKEALVEEDVPEAAVGVRENAKEVEVGKSAEEKGDVAVDARDIMPAAVVALVEPDKAVDAAAAVEEKLASVVRENQSSYAGGWNKCKD